MQGADSDDHDDSDDDSDNDHDDSDDLDDSDDDRGKDNNAVAHCGCGEVFRRNKFVSPH